MTLQDKALLIGLINDRIQCTESLDIVQHYLALMRQVKGLPTNRVNKSELSLRLELLAKESRDSL